MVPLERIPEFDQSTAWEFYHRTASAFDSPPLLFVPRPLGKERMVASILVLVVMDLETRGPLVEILESSAVQVLAVGSCQEARQVLKTYPVVEVVITELSHRDGNWCDLLEWVVNRGLAVSVVVSCKADIADAQLWSEVFWRGGYDLLVDPYEDSEVRSSVEAAACAARRMARPYPPLSPSPSRA